MLPTLGKLALAFLSVEAVDAFVVRRWWRRRTYAAALKKAAELGKPLLVVGLHLGSETVAGQLVLLGTIAYVGYRWIG